MCTAFGAGVSQLSSDSAELSLSEPLGSHHDRSAFSCGNEALDRYLQQQATQDVRRGLAAVFITCANGTNRVVGYYTLSAFALLPNELPHESRRRLPRYERFPTILLGRLAVDLRTKGKRLGGRLLVEALQRSLRESEQIGALAVVVDAIDQNAEAFYRHHDFESLPDHPQRLFLPMRGIQDLPQGPRSGQ